MIFFKKEDNMGTYFIYLEKRNEYQTEINCLKFQVK